jgi:hypothetical protein
VKRGERVVDALVVKKSLPKRAPASGKKTGLTP